jgi:pyruvate formate lyase activating enzyme
MATCAFCGNQAAPVSRALGACARCICANPQAARQLAARVHAAARRPFELPPAPPRSRDGLACTQCANRCRIGPGQVGYCGVRRHDGQHLCGGDVEAAAVAWYHDPLPTNCVADWVCPASTAAGYPLFTDTRGPELGYTNLAVFYEACSFDCLFCQNWHYRDHSRTGPRHSAAELAAAVDARTRCICFFGGDPACQLEHALEAARLARQRHGNRILRICWETNGSMSRSGLTQMVEISLQTGGCIKFDLKAWDEPLHFALCGVSNRRTLANFEYLARYIPRRPDPPPLVASTLLVPGYVDADQVARIAAFLARLDASIPYALLAFHPAFLMDDLPTTSRRQAQECLAAATAAGLKRVRIGNPHLLT